MVSKATISRLSARIDGIIASRQPPGGRQVVFSAPYDKDDESGDVAIERHCAEHPEDRNAALYVILIQFTKADCEANDERLAQEARAMVRHP
jgi:hypothetical protein